MAELSGFEIGVLLRPYLVDLNADMLDKLGAYLGLLLKWNARTNLTAIRDPGEIVRRHFGESLFAATRLAEPETLLDYGSGAGFPGIPLALARPQVRVTLAESQVKKSAFLREAVRVLGLSVQVWGRRVEELPRGARFDCVTMRSVDDMTGATEKAWELAEQDLVLMTTGVAAGSLDAPAGFELADRILIPGSEDRIVLRFSRSKRP